MVILYNTSMSVHKSRFETSDFIAYSIISLFVTLELILPTDLGLNIVTSRIAGILIIIFAWTIIFLAKYQFKKHNQKSGPNNETTELIKTGLFKYTRNPIYLGVIFIAPAIGFIINSAWLIFAVFPTAYLMQYFLILPEENIWVKYLETSI